MPQILLISHSFVLLFSLSLLVSIGLKGADSLSNAGIVGHFELVDFDSEEEKNEKDENLDNYFHKKPSVNIGFGLVLKHADKYILKKSYSPFLAIDLPPECFFCS